MINEIKVNVLANLICHVLSGGQLNLRVQMRLRLLLLFAILLLLLLLQSHPQVLRDVVLCGLTDDLRDVRLAHVHEHVRVGEPRQTDARNSRSGALVLTVLLVQRLGHLLLRHSFIVELEPLTAQIWTNVGVVVSAVDAAAVHQHGVQQVLVSHGPVSVGGEILAVTRVQVELLREFVAIVDLNHRVALEVVLEAFELQLQHRGKLREQHALLRVLQSVTFGAVFVLPVHLLHLDVLVEARVHVLASLDVKLQI